ncbi:MAG: hypothetical protein JXA77_12950 [Bacteroidales bacterium]|nr:hypothetical protein [Bacteroidales bacterium]
MWKYFQSRFFRQIQNRRIEFPVEQFGNDNRAFFNLVNKNAQLGIEKGGYDDIDIIGSGSAAGHLGFNAVAINADLFNRPLARVRCATGQTVAVIDIVERVEPLLPPPCFSECRCHSIC